MDSVWVHFRLWPFLMCLLLSYDYSPLPCDCVCLSFFPSSLSEENLICLKPPDRVHMTRTSRSRTVRATTVWFVKNRSAVLSHLISSQLWWDTMWLIWVPSTACVWSLSRSWLIKMNQGIKLAENYQRHFSDVILLRMILQSYAALLKRFWAVQTHHNSFKSKDAFVIVDFIHFFICLIYLINTI